MSAVNKLLVISGPSGCGKSTLLRRLLAEHSNRFGFSVSHTTRSPRPGEIDGHDYHYVSKEAFADILSKGQFLEHAEFSSNCYGTSLAAVKSVENAGKRCILDVELQGVQSIRKLGYPATFVLIQPPSLEELEVRLRNRNTETEESLQKRLATARREFDLAKSSGLFDYVIINDVLETAYAKLAEIALA